MSDFDKEAEREKLREKYERDEEERRATQRMSDLLLKGATMTNAHCGTCGDPLFQMDGTTFCPSCHGNPDAVEGTDLEARPAEESADGTAEPADASANPNPDASGDAEESATADTGAETADPDRQQRRPSDAGAADAPRSPTDDATRTASSSRETSPTADRSQPRADDPSRSAEPSAADRTAAPSPSGRSASGDLEAAHDSLVAALEKFAAKAAETDDPRYATECLEAAREAAETLETLR